MADNNDDFKKKREQFVYNIRKQKRQQIFSKKRNMNEEGKGEQYFRSLQGIEAKPILIIDPRYAQQIQILANAEYSQSMFDELAQLIDSPDVLEQHRAVIGIRKILAKTVDPPIKKFIDKGLTNKCIQLTKQNSFPQIKLESTWILSNVASGESKFCQKLVERGGIELFINLLNENERGIIDQAIWGIGNLAADNTKYRDQILKKGGLQSLIKVIENAKSATLIKNGSWAVTNLCRGQPVPDFQLIKNAVGLLCKVVKSGVLKPLNNKDVLSDIIWAISYMAQGSKSKIQRVNQYKILGQIFQFALDPYKELHIPAIKIIGNFSTGNENHTDELIKNGIFDIALNLLDHPKKPIRKQMCWILSNIAAGTAVQVQQFLSHTALLEKISMLFHEEVDQIKREICWIYGNFSHLGNRKKLIQFYIHYDVIRIFCNLLLNEDSENIENALENLYKLLFIGKKQEVNNKNLILQKFLEFGGQRSLQKLQYHQNPRIYEGTVKILTKFFQLETPGI